MISFSNFKLSKLKESVKTLLEMPVHPEVDSAWQQARMRPEVDWQQERKRGGRMVQQTNWTDDLIAKIEVIKDQMRKLIPQVQDYSDPQMMKLVRELYAATTLFTKSFRPLRNDNRWDSPPQTEDIYALHKAMEELISHTQ